MFESKNAGGWALALVALGLFIGLVLRDLIRKESPSETTPAVAMMVPTQDDRSRGVDELTSLFERAATQCSPFLVTLAAMPSTRATPPSHHFSGVLMSPDGYILTAARLVSSMRQVLVTLSNRKSLVGEVLGSDPLTDIAVIKVAASGLKGIRQGNSDGLRSGQWVIALGNAGHDRHAVTAGIVSVKGRANSWLADDEDFLLTDAEINSDNDGGALVDLQGRLVGINTRMPAREHAPGLGRAIPINMAREVMRRIFTEGRFTRGALGIQMQDLDAQLAKALRLGEKTGVLLSEVLPDNAAANAGLQRGDVVIQYGDKQVANAQTLHEMIVSSRPDLAVPVTVMRDGKELTVNAIVNEYQAPGAEIGASRVPTISSSHTNWGFVTNALTSTILHERKLPMNTPGVLVSEVLHGSPAELAGVRAGDIVQEWDHRHVAGQKDFRTKLTAVQAGQTILLLLKRGERSLYCALAIPEAPRAQESALP